MKDNFIYDHFNHCYRDPETWRKTHQVMPVIKNILLGALSIACMAIMSLGIIILLWR